ncbi:MAG: hypothetical protein A2579_09915 [Lysobacterales bacterium RIFOXYD1_FULL_69_11]|nr:MAG: hypothetical protein A2190_05665 [Xanthomonadales bacterium RIFOXYA1_FULL_69_10]OHE88176.1 MAG: hypothetical protein A2579_09915 [Xanthomonadales bacterium RIFOXYD1_FULL_69_11]
MFLPCPHCGFLVSLLAPGDAQGQRCPRCEQRLEDPAASEPLDDATATAVAAEGMQDASGIDAPADATPPPPVDASNEDEDGATTATATVANAPAQPPGRRARTRGRHGPSFARITLPGEADTLRWPLRIAAALLTALLLLQLLLAQRAELATDAGWRPWVQAACSAFGCTVPAWHEPGAFQMLDRNVRPKVGTNGVLEVTASFRNDARWPQAWPTLRVGLTDVDGREVAARAFTPDEYRTSTNADALLAPGQSAAVRFDVREPAAPIVAFTFDFR